MTSIPAIVTNHTKILNGLRDSRLCNKLAESKAKKWTNMSQIVQDVTAPLLETMGLRGCHFCGFWEDSKIGMKHHWLGKVFCRYSYLACLVP